MLSEKRMKGLLECGMRQEIMHATVGPQPFAELFGFQRLNFLPVIAMCTRVVVYLVCTCFWFCSMNRNHCFTLVCFMCTGHVGYLCAWHLHLKYLVHMCLLPVWWIIVQRTAFRSSVAHHQTLCWHMLHKVVLVQGDRTICRKTPPTVIWAPHRPTQQGLPTR